MNRTIIIGDVHGMVVELQSMLEKIESHATDTFVFVGDLVDKGPEAIETVRLIRNLSEQFNIVVLQGNHEEKHNRYRKHLASDNGVADTMTGADEMGELTKAMSEKDKDFMEDFVPFHKIQDYEILVVHAGIPGNMKEFPGTIVETLTFSNEQRKSLSRILRTRHINIETGEAIRLGEETEADPFWAEVYDGRFGHVVFGHEPFMEGVRKFPHATGIDTGAVFGGSLTAMILEGGKRKFVSVPSRGKYSKRLEESGGIGELHDTAEESIEALERQSDKKIKGCR